MSIDTPVSIIKKSRNRSISWLSDGFRHMKRDRQLLILLIPCIVFYIVFRYGPIYGVTIAFKKFSVFTGIINSPWVGFKYFEQFFSNQEFGVLFKNTLLLGAFSLLWSFPFPIILAVLLNELKSNRFKKWVQAISNLPSFLSVVIVCSMVINFLSPNDGLINQMISALGFEKQYFLSKPEWFRTIYISSGIWAGMGYGSIVYLAAISGVDPSLYEAAVIDGCSRFRLIWNITIPSIIPTIVTMFILSSGSIFNVGYEKVLLLYMPTTYSVADVFSTYVYRKGLIDMNYSYAAAAGLFQSVISLITILTTNYLSKKVSEKSLF
jgi:putative aldouronate transport system permease protein